MKVFGAAIGILWGVMASCIVVEKFVTPWLGAPPGLLAFVMAVTAFIAVALAASAHN